MAGKLGKSRVLPRCQSRLESTALELTKIGEVGRWGRGRGITIASLALTFIRSLRLIIKTEDQRTANSVWKHLHARLNWASRICFLGQSRLCVYSSQLSESIYITIIALFRLLKLWLSISFPVFHWEGEKLKISDMHQIFKYLCPESTIIEEGIISKTCFVRWKI